MDGGGSGGSGGREQRFVSVWERWRWRSRDEAVVVVGKGDFKLIGGGGGIGA